MNGFFDPISRLTCNPDICTPSCEHFLNVPVLHAVAQDTVVKGRGPERPMEQIVDTFSDYGDVVLPFLRQRARCCDQRVGL